MEKYNYLESIKKDVLEYLKENYSTRELLEHLDTVGSKDEFSTILYDDLWIDDVVTGNASGSYTFCTWMAEENLCHNLDLLKEALDEFGGNYSDALGKGAEYCDVTIRCYLLGPAISQAINELEEYYNKILPKVEE